MQHNRFSADPRERAGQGQHGVPSPRIGACRTREFYALRAERRAQWPDIRWYEGLFRLLQRHWQFLAAAGVLWLFYHVATAVIEAGAKR